MTTHVMVQDLGLKKGSGKYPQWKINEGANHFDLTVDGKTFLAEEGDTILVAARKAGIEIPSMCSDSRTNPNGDCGMCVVEIDGNPEPVKACEIKVREGMQVVADSPALTALRRPILNNYLSNHNAYCLPPCSYKCPAGIDIPGYIGLIAQKKYVEATALIKEKLPLPQIIGRGRARVSAAVRRWTRSNRSRSVR
jgi:formate dehydrogenase major subunit